MQKKYVKFIILGSARTGSSYVVDLLKSHPNIQAHSELFETAGLVRNKIGLNDASRYYAKIFGKYPRHIKAVGFKIFYSQANRDLLYIKRDMRYSYSHRIIKKRMNILHNYLNWLLSTNDQEMIMRNIENIWNLLRQDPELKVIHLKRKNKLRVLISRIKASSLAEHIHRRNDSKYNKFSFCLGYDYCLSFFQKIEEKESKYDKLFSESPELEITYEELAENLDVATGKILDFLEVPRRKLVSSMKKQNTQKMSESITNYWELKKKFKNTQWAEFFEE